MDFTISLAKIIRTILELIIKYVYSR